MAQNAAFINRSLTTVVNELDFLKDSGVISEAFYNEVTRALPKKYDSGMAPVQSITGGAYAAPAAHAEVPTHTGYSGSEQIAEAVYDYEPRENTDLRLYKGARIAVLERLNPDWWKGRSLDNGQEGIFPSSYVRLSDEKSVGYPQVSAPPLQPVQSAPPQGPPAYFPPPSTNYYGPPGGQAPMAGPSMPQQQQQQQPQQAQPQQAPHMPDAFKKFGSKLGNAAIFGAGATIGSDLVNSIF